MWIQALMDTGGVGRKPKLWGTGDNEAIGWVWTEV